MHNINIDVINTMYVKKTGKWSSKGPVRFDPEAATLQPPGLDKVREALLQSKKDSPGRRVERSRLHSMLTGVRNLY